MEVNFLSAHPSQMLHKHRWNCTCNHNWMTGSTCQQLHTAEPRCCELSQAGLLWTDIPCPSVSSLAKVPTSPTKQIHIQLALHTNRDKGKAGQVCLVVFVFQMYLYLKRYVSVSTNKSSGMTSSVQHQAHINTIRILSLICNKQWITNTLLNMFIYSLPSVLIRMWPCILTHTHPTATLPAQFHPTDIGIFRKSKPIDNLLQNYKRSIANFFALITTWTFNMRPVATMCVPPA